MERELRPLVRALSLVPTDSAGTRAWRSDDVVAAVVGVGPGQARRDTARVLDATGAAQVLVVGVAGAIAPWLRVGDVVVPESVLDGSAPPLRPHALARPTGPPTTPLLRRGTLATVARLGAPAPEGAWAVDLETAGIAAECEARGVPWDVRRAVSDVPGTLDPAIATLLRPDGRVDGWAVARLLARRPQAALTLGRLGRDTKRAVEAVTRSALDELRG